MLQEFGELQDKLITLRGLILSGWRLKDFNLIEEAFNQVGELIREEV